MTTQISQDVSARHFRNGYARHYRGKGMAIGPCQVGFMGMIASEPLMRFSKTSDDDVETGGIHHSRHLPGLSNYFVKAHQRLKIE